MLNQPLIDNNGTSLSLMQTMPGLGVCVTLASKDQQVIRFNADAVALKELSAVLAAAATMAERVARK